MARLVHNQTIQISGEDLRGLYRVILNEISQNIVLLVRLDKPIVSGSNGRPLGTSESNRKRKPPMPLCGQLLWFDSTRLSQLYEQGHLSVVEIGRGNFSDSCADVLLHANRKMVMTDFLQFDTLRKSIINNGSIGPLVAEAVKKYGVSRHLIYKCWSLLCRFGFAEDSLRSRLDRCGAPGVVRDCSDTGRKKSGRKTNRQRLAQKTGEPNFDGQPGMNAIWRQLIMVADKKIPSPKPRFARRYQVILEEGFIKRFCDDCGAITPLPLKVGEYPNKRQVRRVLEIETPRLQRILEQTTKGHYLRSLRGMTGRSWKGVSGPGHTWAIDSTIGDIYLRSSINRAWIIGRPIVYVIVDVWSTAVVGFYVCLTGPSWQTAKISLFNAVVDSALLGDLWGFETVESLRPFPTLPSVILGDRGEYLSYAAKETAFHLVERMSYTPPYRPDLKGLVEVLHRIEKDHQNWIPGAIDARRVEFELRKFDPNSAIFTVSEYTEYLHNVFAEYNLTADRTGRIDTSMISAGVPATPAGLWRWGHEAGIGTSRYFSQEELIKKLLPLHSASVTRSGVYFEKLLYESELINSAQWTAQARNFGSRDIPCFNYPGSVSRIWTPDTVTGVGLLQLRISEQANASKDQTYEEVLDAFAYNNLDKDITEHNKLATKMKLHNDNNQLVARAKSMTKQATEAETQPQPPLSVARQKEILVSKNDTAASAQIFQVQVENEDENSSYAEMLKAVLDAKKKQ